MRLPASLLALALLLAVGLSCNLAERFVGEDNSVMVTDLWPDVPPFPGAVKTDNKLPLPMRIIFSKVMKGKASFITFRTDKPPEEVKDFYAGNSMTDAGWARIENTCFRDTKEQHTGGMMCSFTKSGAKQEMVAVMVQPESSATTIFYMRIDITDQQQNQK